MSSPVLRSTRFWTAATLGGVGLAALLSACASIIHGTAQDVGISSSPTGAQVTVDNQPRGATPTIVKLSRKDHHIVKIELPGYQPFEATITRSVSGWVWGNIVFGGIIGLAVDAITGGLYKLSPEQIAGTLLEQHASESDDDGVMLIAVVLEPGIGWSRIGTLARE